MTDGDAADAGQVRFGALRSVAEQVGQREGKVVGLPASWLAAKSNI